MKKVKAVGFIHKGKTQMYDKPLEFNQIRFANGEFLTDSLTVTLIAKRMDDNNFYLLAMTTDPLTFDHKLILEGEENDNKTSSENTKRQPANRRK